MEIAIILTSILSFSLFIRNLFLQNKLTKLKTEVETNEIGKRLVEISNRRKGIEDRVNNTSIDNLIHREGNEPAE